MTTTDIESPIAESFAAMFEESLQRQELRAGEVITAEVTRIDHNFVVVNAGLKSESYIALEEFKDDKGELEAGVGDYVSVAIESIEDGYGETKLSREKAKKLAAAKAQTKELRKAGFERTRGGYQWPNVS